ncbi:MAG: general secretion pathway protein GspD [Prolixibacteraceae bacterium]|nr:general secretion pathway protein GspD [Burkholderiales bacterium]
MISLLALTLGGCATDSGFASDPAFATGKLMIEQGRVEEGLEQVRAASKSRPDNVEYRTFYARSRETYINQLLSSADKQRSLGKFEDAAAFYQRVLIMDAGNIRGQSGLTSVQTEQRHLRMIAEAATMAEAGDSDAALMHLRPVLAENPAQRDAKSLLRKIEETQMKTAASSTVLKSSLRKPVTLEFRDAPLKSVFEVLSRTSGINFVFDRDVRPDLRSTIYVRNIRIEDAVRFLLTTNQLEQKVLSDNTILVYPNLPNKQKDYLELMVKSFYLTNADVKQTLNLVKTVVKTRDVFIDEKLNLLIMRDTPDAIRLAEKLIAAQDLAEPEVMLDVEVLEISRNRLTELGIRYPTQVAVGLQGAAGPGSVTLEETKGSMSELVRIDITDPALILNLRKQDGDVSLLANPRIRVKNREKAKIHIGDKLPVITTTSTANVGVSESVTYLDVGLKLDIEPNVFLDDEVSMKVGLEVSNIVQEIRSANGTLTYRLGTRNTATALRLKSGETQVLAGLIQDVERNIADKVPGLGDLPVVGRLFRSDRDERNKTEIVLLITPRVVRNLDRPGATSLEFMSGTDAAAGGGTFGLRSADTPPPAPVPVSGPAPVTVPTPPVPLPVRPDPDGSPVPLPGDER